MAGMTHTQLYITWGMLAVLLLALGSVAKAVELLREEVEEFRQFMMGEKPYDSN
jgi:predicted phage tail protein